MNDFGLSAKELYEMRLHKQRHIKGSLVTVLRVPGGWIYFADDRNNDSTKTSTFVPYNEEFYNEERKVI